MVDRAKDRALRDTRGRRPGVDGGFDPTRDGYGPDVARLTDEVGDDPVVLPLLNRLKLQDQEFAATQSTADEHRQHRVIPSLAQRRR